MEEPNIPLEELTEEEDAQMLELILKVVQMNAKSPMDVVGKNNADAKKS